MAVHALLVGADIPVAIPLAVGMTAERIDSAAGLPGLDRADCVIFSHLRAENARTHHRMLAAGGAPTFFLDLPAGRGRDVRAYSEQRLRRLSRQLEIIGRSRLDEARLIRELDAEWSLARAPQTAPPGGFVVARLSAVTARDAETTLRSRGLSLAWMEGEDGFGSVPSLPTSWRLDPWRTIAEVHEHRIATSTRASMTARAHALAQRVAQLDAAGLVLLGDDESDSDAWFRATLRRELRGSAQLIEIRADAEKGLLPAARTPTGQTEPAASPRPRARKLLSIAARFSDYQRDWFGGIRARAAAGDPFAVVNADAPQEILRALDIPFVVNQWWASIAAAKGGTARSREALRDGGLPPHAESYNSQGIADFLAGPDGAPWGGLPVPSVLQFVRNEDAVAGIYEEWARLTGAEVIAFDRTIESRIDFPVDWWDALPTRWEETLESERLDIMTAQIRDSIAALERVTGRRLDPARLQEVLDLVNEQEEWYRKTRDLIAATHPAPVSIVDTIPATMIPQWHRGTVWGRDAAKAFHDEVATRVAEGEAACDSERIRVLWVGRGLWQHMWLYQAFERSHGAVFVWSMYLGLAADGYLRYAREDQDPIRALAARFVTVGDELRMPRWAAAWHVAEATRHRADAVIAIDDAEPFVLDELERSGLPVLRLAEGNLAESADAMHDTIRDFLDTVERR